MVSSSDKTKPLSGVTVMEIAGPNAQDMHHLALGFAGRIAADLGADVNRIVEVMDPLDRLPVLPWEKNRAPIALSGFLNASKTVLSVSRYDEAAELLKILNPNAVLTRRDNLPGISVDTVVVRLSTLPIGHPFGDGDEPPIGEIGLLALSGLLDLVGDPNREPLVLGGHQPAFSSGFACFSALMTGLAKQESTGQGDVLDVTMLDVANWINWKGVASSILHEGNELTREGVKADWRVIAANDGWVALVITDRDWRAVACLLNDNALLNQIESGLAISKEMRSAIYDKIERWASVRSREEVYRTAQALEIPFGPVLEPGELQNDRHLLSRSVFAEIDYHDTTLTCLSAPIIWSGERFYPKEPSTSVLAQCFDREARTN